MPVYRLPEEHAFPSPHLAEPDGLLGVGGDLHPERLLLGYANSIFPWYGEGQPILWFSPDPRYVLFPDELKVRRSLKKRVRRGDYTIRMDTAFGAVLRGCRNTPRPGQNGTWITSDMEAAYLKLHRLGFAHSVEAWQDGELVGGLYGVSLGHMFSGESMFAKASDASKVAFVWLVHQLRVWGYGIVDCQVETEHLASFGARHVSREEYLEHLRRLVPDGPGPGLWRFDADFVPPV